MARHMSETQLIGKQLQYVALGAQPAQQAGEPQQDEKEQTHRAQQLWPAQQSRTVRVHNRLVAG